MKNRVITKASIQAYATQLKEEEKSPVTIEKYLRDIHTFVVYSAGESITKDMLISYKQHLVELHYAIGSINSMLISINRFLHYLGWEDCTVHCLKQQNSAFCPEEKELTKEEYLRLLKAAASDQRLYLLLQSICGTGIRVSELQYFTVEAVAADSVQVRCKSKSRKIIIPGNLRKKLLSYCRQMHICSGPIFCTRNGKPLDRSNIWHMMKALCQKAEVPSSKVFPHNLRKLFARCFYKAEKDIAKLADVLGHSSINTTRIYLMTTGTEHRKQVEQLGLII